PLATSDPTQAEQQVREHVQRYFEETWIHRPLRSLNNVPPIDPTGHETLRKQLIGVVQFLQECTASAPEVYDFDRLRRKLGLLTAGAAAIDPEAGMVLLDNEAMNAAELGALQPETLSDEQLEQAYRIAQKLDARELAGRFARTLVSCPPRSEQPDR